MADQKPKSKQFPEGDVLTAAEGGEVVRSAPASVVVVAGPARCGKTTLVAGLYELFHRGPFGGYMFAGSRTLPGFERRCHLARLASGLETPDTERTLRSEGKDLLHLRLAANGSRDYRNILFSDIYGEAFRRAADVAEDCQKFNVLKRADHVTILVDGAKAANRQDRQSAFSSADALIGQCLDCGMFDDESSVQVAVTKWDLVAGNASNEQFVSGKLDWLRRLYSTRLGRFSSHRVSVRPTAGAIDLGFGMAELLEVWTQVRWRTPLSPNVPARMYHTEFDRIVETFALRQSGVLTGG